MIDINVNEGGRPMNQKTDYFINFRETELILKTESVVNKNIEIFSASFFTYNN